MLHVFAPASHFRLSARFHTASDDRIASARFTISRSSAFGAISAAVSTWKRIVESFAAYSDTAYQPLYVRITPPPPEYSSISTSSAAEARSDRDTLRTRSSSVLKKR